MVARQADAATCSCDPAQDSINDPACPTHGAEIRTWQAWEQNESRCPYCVGVEWDDFEAICDCWRFEYEEADASTD